MNVIIRRVKYYLIRLFRLKEGARQIALGFVFGLFPCWYPTFGIGPLLSIGLSKLVKGNVIASVISAALGSVIWLPLFLLNYQVGNSLKSLWKADEQHQRIVLEIDDVEYSEPIKQINKFHDYGSDFLVGALFNSVIFSLIAYVIVYFIFSKYRNSILSKLLKE
jgi:uncharacterized protein (DUF2062 family)